MQNCEFPTKISKFQKQLNRLFSNFQGYLTDLSQQEKKITYKLGVPLKTRRNYKCELPLKIKFQKTGKIRHKQRGFHVKLAGFELKFG